MPIISTMSMMLNGLKRLFSKIFGRQSNCHLPLAVPHRTINDEELSKFNEVIVIGDVHGCYDEWCLLLEQITNGYPEPEKILKICVGDLVNKGPKSLEMIDYCMKNSDHCISVRGNHDQVIIDEYVRYANTGECKKKNAWIRTMTEDQFNFLQQLPYSITIPKLESIVVHAGLVPGIALEEQNPKKLMEIRNLVIDPETGTLTGTKKDDEGEAWAPKWPGPKHIYFGHDAKRGLQEEPFATGLDTGVVYGKHLTALFIMGPRKGQYSTVKALKMYRNPEPQ